MINDPTQTPGSTGTTQSNDDVDRVRERSAREMHSAKEEARELGDKTRAAAADLGEKAKEQARSQGEKGKETVAGGLDDFAAAVRKASDELGDRDQSMASQLVREVAGGLEHASKTIHGKDVGELTQSVARFARERPATFLVGAALAGLALGRFARSSGEHSEADYADGGSSMRDYRDRRDDDRPDYAPARPVPTGGPAGARSTIDPATRSGGFETGNPAASNVGEPGARPLGTAPASPTDPRGEPTLVPKPRPADPTATPSTRPATPGTLGTSGIGGNHDH
ncbi:hypothetical protein U0C82_06440 [Fulvimarina sp. 2208YS6-2-32]|uniref:DUF3618 domain-containing protein n=1 Tax=Fulvimarina uroteuthidis TaxID=3098149 RepID=A0ABU5I075_9HYPH|nr:hypothetical protein [Fulvimarina sp. 2208YS6-2-32]MDY8108782.1 hypothetical protein [Fulvimarina sp. 2208YS6-2-32]